MNNNDNHNESQFINRAGRNKYLHPDSVDNLIKYISRENGDSRKDLICQGTIGAIAFNGTDTIIQQFKCVQALHTRKGNFGRYIDHEIYSFSNAEIEAFKEKNIPPDIIAKNMAMDIFQEGFQVHYGFHKPDNTNKHPHVHFAVNTVNYNTGNKRHENITSTNERKKRLENIVAEIIATYEANENETIVH